MKKALQFLLIVGLSILCTYVVIENNKKQITTLAITPNSLLSSPETRFIEICSGLSSTDNNFAVLGVSNCLGRIQGFSDGHLLTVQLVNVSSPEVGKGLELWCLSNPKNAKQLLDAVFTWVKQNPDQMNKTIIDTGEVNGTMMIIIEALHSAYPCERK
jgi:Rap1a immunity proteins